MNIPYLILGAIAGIVISRLIITALRRRAADPADTSLPSAADASERGDRASIPKQNSQH